MPEYTEGHGELIRALRLYTGLSQREMARRIGRERRDYQRIENGQDACPAEFLAAMQKMANQFDNAVDVVIAAAEQMRSEGRGFVHLQVLGDDFAAWERAVVGRAAVETGFIMPTLVGKLGQREEQPA